jgi:hypothetical protein
MWAYQPRRRPALAHSKKDHIMVFLKSTAARRFTITLAATATALALMTAAAVPARAENRQDNVAAALAAVAAIAIIGVALNENDGRRDHRANAAPPPPRVVHSPRELRNDGRRHRHASDRYAPVLPAQCAVQVRDRRQISVAYTERCLRRSGVEGRLPRQCEVSLDARGRTRTAYDQNCLLNSGFRVQGRGRH